MLLTRCAWPVGLPVAIILIMWLRVVAGAQAPATPTQPASPPSPPAVQSPVLPPPAPVIMIDPAHGGTESGAVLAPDNLEKDVTLAFARRLQQDLIARGLQARLMRDSDTMLSTDQRASIANATRSSLYVCVHATSQGTGLRIY